MAISGKFSVICCGCPPDVRDFGTSLQKASLLPLLVQDGIRFHPRVVAIISNVRTHQITSRCTLDFAPKAGVWKADVPEVQAHPQKF